jgi:hypothetical protein
VKLGLGAEGGVLVYRRQEKSVGGIGRGFNVLQEDLLRTESRGEAGGYCFGCHDAAQIW